MRRLLFAVAVSTVAAGSLHAQTFVTSIDISTQISASTGIHAAHIAVDNTGANPILYVNPLNNGANGQTLNIVKIADPLGTPAISTFTTNDAGGAGVNATRGSGGIAVDGAGNVFVGWTGNANDDTARVRRSNSAGSNTGEWLFSGSLADRPGGLDVNAAGTGFVVARFLSTATMTSHYEITGTSAATRTFVTTPATHSGQNPRDIAFDATNDKLYINTNGTLMVINGPAATPLFPAAPWGTGSSTVLQNLGANSFAGHGVGINADGSLIGFSPNQNAGVGARTFRIVNPAGDTVYTLGTLDTPGDGTGALLQRPVDAAFFSVGGNDYVAITDYQLNTFSRVVVYDITPLPPSTVTVGPSGDFATIQAAISAFTSTGSHATAIPPFTINIDPAGSPYNERITLTDTAVGQGDIVGDLTIQSSVPGTLARLALQRDLSQAAGPNTACVLVHQGLHNITFRDLLIHPALPGVGVEDARRYIIKIDENSPNATMNTITLQNVIVSEVAADGLPLISSRAEAYNPPRAASASAFDNQFTQAVQFWGDNGESLSVVLDNVVLYGPPPAGLQNGNLLRAAFSGSNGESLTVINSVFAYGPTAAALVRIGANNQYTGTVSFTAGDQRAGLDNANVFLHSSNTEATHALTFEGSLNVGAAGAIPATVSNAIFKFVGTGTPANKRAISAGTASWNVNISDVLIDVPGAAVVSFVPGTTTWNNITAKSNEAWFGLGGAGSLAVTNSIFVGADTVAANGKFGGTAPTGGASIENCGFGTEVTNQIGTAVTGTFTTANNHVGDPDFKSSDFKSADFFDVQNPSYAGKGTSGSDLAGGANFTPVFSHVGEWMILND
jgi:hypothetical protein